MELTRRAYAEESQALLRKQQSTVDKLRKDNDALKNDIALIMRGSHGKAANAASQMESIQYLQDQGDHYANSIDFERRNIETMDEQIHIMRYNQCDLHVIFSCLVITTHAQRDGPIFLLIFKSYQIISFRSV